MVKSLKDLCTAVCIKNVRDIDDVGGAPYAILRPILMKVDNPQQLLDLEEKSPHIRGDTAECWQRLINRDFPHQVKKYHLEPRNPDSWPRIYNKYKAIEVEQKQTALAKLTSGFKNIKKEKQAKAIKAINYDPKLLGTPGRRRGSGFGHSGGSGLGSGHGGNNTGGLRFGGGSRTKTTSARNIMLKARREAAEMQRRNKLATPTGQLSVPRGQIAQAPLSMREAYRINSLPNLKRIQAPPQVNGARRAREEKERDERLLKVKNEVPAEGVTIVSDDELFSEDEEAEYSDEDQAPGLLTAEFLEGPLEEPRPSTAKGTKAAPMSQNKSPSSYPSASSFTSKPNTSGMSGLAKMKLGRSWKDKPMRIEPIETSTAKSAFSKPSASSPTESKFTTATSPSLPSRPSMPQTQPSSSSSTAAGPSNSGENPVSRPDGLVRKRKAAPNVFMKPMSKSRKT